MSIVLSRRVVRKPYHTGRSPSRVFGTGELDSFTPKEAVPKNAAQGAAAIGTRQRQREDALYTKEVFRRKEACAIAQRALSAFSAYLFILCRMPRQSQEPLTSTQRSRLHRYKNGDSSNGLRR